MIEKCKDTRVLLSTLRKYIRYEKLAYLSIVYIVFFRHFHTKYIDEIICIWNVGSDFYLYRPIF